jgi:hypothetical protein
MGEAKLRKQTDPNYGKHLTYDEWVNKVHEISNVEDWSKLNRLLQSSHYIEYRQRLDHETEPPMVQKCLEIKLGMLAFLAIN